MSVDGRIVCIVCSRLQGDAALCAPTEVEQVAKKDKGIG